MREHGNHQETSLLPGITSYLAAARNEERIATTMTAAANARLTEIEREHIILEHMPQVRLIARRIHERVPGSISLEDLISTGTLG